MQAAIILAHLVGNVGQHGDLGGKGAGELGGDDVELATGAHLHGVQAALLARGVGPGVVAELGVGGDDDDLGGKGEVGGKAMEENGR